MGQHRSAALQGLERRNIWYFLLHSAERRVIDLARELIRRDERQVANSRRVLQWYSNMSSATPAWPPGGYGRTKAWSVAPLAKFEWHNIRICRP